MWYNDNTVIEQKPTPLSPAQAADVIRYYDLAENADYHEAKRGKRKIALALVAIHAASGKHSIMPDKAPLLTHDEKDAGLEYLALQSRATSSGDEALGSWPVEPTDEEWEQIYRKSDTQAIPIDEAYAQIMGIVPNHWK